MPPKSKFSKNDIIDVAFEIAKVKGVSQITARSVASKLQSSVAPIYVHFNTIEDLVGAVIERIMDLSERLILKQKGHNAFEKIGKASLAFAKDYPVLFREMTLSPHSYMDSYETLEITMLETLAKDEDTKTLDFTERRRMLLKMRAFQIGLSVMMASDQLPSWLKEEDLDDFLMETGHDIQLAQHAKRKREEK